MKASSSKKLTHLDEQGRARMVDVGHKSRMMREAEARGFLRMAPSTIKLLRKRALPKGDALAVARVAGIQAAKETSRLIPLCHTLPLDAVNVEFLIGVRGIEIRAVARVEAKTGVEMEALMAVAVASLALYDMCKAVDKGMILGPVRLVRKTKNAVV